VVAAVIALASALAGFTMVKFFGVVFLGKARSPEPGRAREPGWPQRAGLIWLALMCTGSGLAPGFLIQAIDPVTRLLAGAGIGPQVARDGLFFAPVDIEQASYAPLILLTSIVLAAGLVLWLLRIRYPRVTRRSAPWNCGYPIGNARMQDSAEGFGQPIRQIFSPLLALQRQLPHPRDESPRYDVQVGDRLWQLLYVPAVRLWIRIGERLERHLPQRIAACLIVAFVTMIVVLAWVER
jgi:NADH:ubiquinone oxidoreductase subunit 5 (subunit L)/multisubunit Na+/H+ antiporter MnhA subunit